MKNRSLLICDCEQTMDIDGKALKTCLGAEGDLTVFSHLCRTQIEAYDRAIESDEPLLVACTQEAPLFREIAEEQGGRDIIFANIRELAGWGTAKKKALPKMAALLAASTHSAKPAGSIPITSQGVCLVYGAGQQAVEVAEALAGRLNVSLMLSDAGDAIPPNVVHVPIYRGKVTAAKGALGKFEVTVDGYAPAMPSSKSELGFLMSRDGAASTCDLIFDMSGGTPLFPAGSRRDGYFHVDPAHPTAVSKAMFDIADLVGEFEKPIYVNYDESICAHGRSGKIGCTNCIDNCPMSAITSDEDNVSIDSLVCGGCGNCSAMCPTGAVSYDYPRRGDLIAKTQKLLEAYGQAGGKNPVLLLHDERHGSALIGAIARFGDGLPANVLPLSLFSATLAGHDFLLAAIAAGAEQVVILGAPDRADELDAARHQAALANAFLAGMGYGGEERIRLVVETDPDATAAALNALPKVKSIAPLKFEAVGGKRDIARTVISRLNETSAKPLELLALPEGAPYGKIQIDTEGCTLCLACIGACPANALADSPDLPQLRFTEAACVQCGLCRATCPESVITLEPRFNFSSDAMTPVVLNEEEPFECIGCGKPFGTKSSVERVVAKLGGKHSMFRDAEQTNLIKMCDDCRIMAQSERKDNPLAMGERPRVRTTQDYIDAEAAAKKANKPPDDFLS